MTEPDRRLPAWIRWQQRRFPDANLLLLDGSHPAPVDSGCLQHSFGRLGEN